MINKKVPSHLRKAGNTHKYMTWQYKQEKKELENSREKFEAIEYLKNKYQFTDGLTYADPKNWEKEDKKLFINIWTMDGYSESQIKRMYKIYV